jgi:dynactin complex subunit
MLNGNVLDTLTKIMVRFPEGSDYVTQFVARAKTEGIDLRDLKITISTDNDSEDRFRRIEDQMRRAYPDQAKLVTANTFLTTRVAELEIEVKTLTRKLKLKREKADEDTQFKTTLLKEETKKYLAEAKKLLKEAKALNAERVQDHPLTKMALEALCYVAAKPFSQPMSQSEMIDAISRVFGGTSAVEVCQRMAMDEIPEQPPEWLRIILRTRQPLPIPPPPKAPRKTPVRKGGR